MCGNFKRAGIERHRVDSYANSGCGAISLACHRGADRVILVGYDAKKDGRRVHHHGDHPGKLGNAKSMPTWPNLFDKLARDMERARCVVLNASRVTVLASFPRVNLEDIIR